MSTTTPTTDVIIENLKDFGFYHTPTQVKRMYAELINRNNYGYGTGKDVLAQPDEYWHDMDTMSWLALWNEHVAPLARLEQKSVFDTIRDDGTLQGKFDGND